MSEVDFDLMIATIRQAKADRRELRQYELDEYPPHTVNAGRRLMINEDSAMQGEHLSDIEEYLLSIQKGGSNE